MRPLLVALVAAAAVVAAGCLTQEAPGADAAPPDLAPAPLVFTETVAKKPGEIVATKLVTFEVPEGATAVSALLTWDAPSDLTLRLGPEAAPAENAGTKEKAGQSRLVTLKVPSAGTWQARVGSSANDPIEFALEVTVHDGPPEEESVGATLRLPAGRLAEVNLVLEEGARVEWFFRSTGPVLWDVHTHNPDTGGFDTLDQGIDSEKMGSTTAPRRGLYSVSFKPTEGDVTLEYEASGVMRVHSFPQA